MEHGLSLGSRLSRGGRQVTSKAKDTQCVFLTRGAYAALRGAAPEAARLLDIYLARKVSADLGDHNTMRTHPPPSAARNGGRHALATPRALPPAGSSNPGPQNRRRRHRARACW